MGTFGELLLHADPDVAEQQFDAAIADLARIQAALTRFEPTSPIEQLNDAGHGMPDADLREILLASEQAWQQTDGRFDIGVGAQLIAAGYDRDFDLLEHASAPTGGAVAQAGAAAAGNDDGASVGDDTGGEVLRSWLDPSGMQATTATREPSFRFEPDGSVRIREGVRLDVGGIAKGWAADQVRARLAPHGSCLVNLGGDISVHVAEGDAPWPIGVELGLDEDPISLALAYGGLATSGQDRRVWKVAGSDATAHHLIDPSTGRSSTTDILRITVVGATCMDAEVWTKALVLAGTDGAREEAAQRGITSIIVGLDGRSHRTGALAVS